MSNTHKKMIDIKKGDRVYQFKKPDKLIYSIALDKMADNDYYSMIDVIVKNCWVKDSDDEYDLNEEEVDKINLTEDILGNFFNFKKVIVNTDKYNHKQKYKKIYDELIKKHPYIFTVKIADDKVLFFKPLSKEDYKLLFNKLIVSKIDSVDYVLNELWIGGDEINSNDIDNFISLISVPEYVLKHKETSIKKN